MFVCSTLCLFDHGGRLIDISNNSDVLQDEINVVSVEVQLELDSLIGVR